MDTMPGRKDANKVQRIKYKMQIYVKVQLLTASPFFNPASPIIS